MRLNFTTAFAFSILIFLPGLLFAQPPNNDCADATEITDLDGTCVIYPFTDATYDTGANTNGSCANPVDAPNIWFSFTADGSEVDIDIFGIGDNAELSLGEFNGGDCQPGNYTELESSCTGNELSFDNLQEGETYYLIVTFENSMGTDLRLCIDNPEDGAAPPNDDPCDAEVINPNGTWYSGTTVGANPLNVGGSDITIPGCPDYGESVVFYQFNLSGNQNGFDINFQNVTDIVTINVAVVFFDPDCNSAPTYIDPTYCGPVATYQTLSFDCIDPTLDYYIWVSSNSDEEGDFEIQVDGQEPPAGCSESDECPDALDVNVVTGQTPTCISGCNIGACDDIQGGGCFDNTSQAGVWYSFTTDNDATNVNLSVNSDNINNIQVAIYSGNCGNLTGVACETGNNGQASIIQQNVTNNTEYYVLVSSPTAQADDFELCIGTTADLSNCVTDSDLEVINTSQGSPPTGPFKPGEQVTFRYTINEFTAATNGCQWLQGIVPIFGNGWAPNSFQANGRPVNAVDPMTQYTGNWAWYDQDLVTYKWDSPFYSIFNDPVSGRKKICSHLDPNCINTGVVSGEGMPAGWFAYSPGGSPCCAATGNPNDGWGDGAGCGSMGGWTVDFTLTAREFAGPEGCEETGEIDLSVQVFTFSDGEVGCYSCSPQSNNAVCAEDFPSFASRTNQCCEGPMLIPENSEICSGNSTNIDLISDQDGQFVVSYSWTVDAPGNVIGAAPGSGTSINQTLTNTGNGPSVVVYTITPVNDVGCLGDPSEIEVTVLPEIEAEAYDGPEPIEGCAGASSIVLGGNPTGLGGSGGPYTYQWNNGLPGESNPEVTPNTSTTYRVIVTDGNGCTGEDEVEVIIAPAVLFELVGDTILCEENTPSTMEVVPLTGTAPYDIEWDGPDGFQNGTEAEINVEGNYEVVVTDANGCTGTQTFSIEINSTPDILFTNIDNVDTLCGLEGPYQYLATGISDGNTFFYNWSTPVGPQSGEVVEINGGGNYILTVTDNLGCVATDSFFIPQFPLPEPEILGSDEICSGASAILNVTDTFAQYQWSTGSDTATTPIGGPGTYYITVTADSGCEGIDSFTVNLDLSSIADAGPDQVLTCASDTLILDGTASSSGAEFLVRWETMNGNIRSGSDTYTPVVDQTGQYLVYITNTDTDCEAIDTVTVSIDTLAPAADAGPDQTLTCSLTSTILQGNPTADPSHNTFWTSIEGSFSGDATADSINVNASGRFAVEVTNPVNGCTQTDTVEVFADDDLPVAQAGADGVIDCAAVSFQADGTDSDSGVVYTYNWTTNSGVIESGANTLTPVFSSEGLYALEVLDTLTGCLQTDTLEVLDIRAPLDVSLLSDTTLTCGNDTLLIQPGYDTTSYYNVQWSTADGVIIGSGTEETLTVADGGTYTVSITDPENQCDTSLSILVSVSQDIPIAEAGPDDEIGCNQSVAVLDGTASGSGPHISYQWVAINGGSIQSGANSLTPEVTTGGEYILMVTDTMTACVGMDTASVTIADGRPDVQAGPDRVIDCDSLTVQLEATVLSPDEDFIFEWTTLNGNYIGGENSLTPSVDAAGDYELSVIDTTNGCETVIGIQVTEDLEEPDIIDSYTDSLLCSTTSITLDARGSSEGSPFINEWGTTDGNFIGSITGLEVEVDAPGNYVLTITNTDNNCTQTQDFTVVEDRELPIADIEVPSILTCEQDEVVLDASASSQGNDFTYSWTTTDGNILSGADALQATVNEPGTYTLLVTNERNDCSSQLDVEVLQETEDPTLNLAPFGILNCATEDLLLDASASIGGLLNYRWTLPDNTVIEGVSESEITAVSPGSYTLIIIDQENGCSSDTTLQVEIDTLPPQINLGNTQTLTCDQQQLSLEATISQSGANPVINWTTQAGNILTATDGLTIDVDAAGWYRIEVFNPENGCVSTDSVVVELDENLPEIIFEDYDTLNCRNETIVLSAEGSSTGPSISYNWTGPEPGAILTDPAGVQIEVNEPGVYQLTLFDMSNNCETTRQLEVNQNIEAPIIDIVPPAEFNCDIGELAIDASGSSSGPEFTYEWSTVDGNLVSGISSLLPTVRSGGTYTLEITNQINGCSSLETVVVEANFELPQLQLEEEISLNCRDSVIATEVGVNTGGSYGVVWSTSGGNIIGPVDEEQIELDAPGIYRVEVTDSLSRCSNSDSVRVIDQRETPSINISTPQELSCTLREVQITATVSTEGTFEYRWSTDSGVIVSGNGTPSIAVSSPGDYVIEVENVETGCLAVDSVEVQQVENDFEGYSLQVTDALCIGDERGCIAIDSISGGTPPYRMSINGNLFIPADREPCNVPIGENSIVLRDANGCEIEYTFELNPPEIYALDLGEDIVIRSPSTDTLDYTTDLPVEIISDQEWFLNDSLFCRGCENVVIDVSEEYLVNLKLFYADGDCFIEDILHIRYIDELDVFVPNVFTPNGDGRNDFFTIFGDEDVQSIQSLLIFDRWGTQLWEGRNLTAGNEPQGWDGSYQGEIVPVGVYVYTAEIRLDDGSTKRLQGSITVSR